MYPASDRPLAFNQARAYETLVYVWPGSARLGMSALETLQKAMSARLNVALCLFITALMGPPHH